MSLEWIHEHVPQWDENKSTIIGRAPDGIFHLGNYRVGDMIPGAWWRVEENGRTLGYGWMDATWGNAEILLAVAPDARGRGVGSFILERLEHEAARAGMNYMLNVVSVDHPERARTTKWLEARGFERAHDGESLRRRVRD